MHSAGFLAFLAVGAAGFGLLTLLQRRQLGRALRGEGAWRGRPRIEHGWFDILRFVRGGRRTLYPLALLCLAAGLWAYERTDATGALLLAFLGYALGLGTTWAWAIADVADANPPRPGEATFDGWDRLLGRRGAR